MELIESLFTTILPIHIGAVFITLAIVFSSDIYGALWVFGKRETLDKKVVKWLHDVVWIGLVVIVVTGAALFLPYNEFLLYDVAFQLKMLFVICLSINAFIIGRLMNIAETHTFASLSWRERAPLLLSGMVSVTGWVGAFIASQFVGL